MALAFVPMRLVVDRRPRAVAPRLVRPQVDGVAQVVVALMAQARIADFAALETDGRGAGQRLQRGGVAVRVGPGEHFAEQAGAQFGTGINGQERPVLLKLRAVNSFEGDIAVSFTDLDTHTDLDFHGGDMPLDELAKLGIVKKDGDRYVPGDIDAGTPYYARYKDVSGAAGGEGEGGTETVTTHPVLLTLDLATGLDSGA